RDPLGRAGTGKPASVAPRAEDRDIDWLASEKLGIGFGWPTPIAAGRISISSTSMWLPIPAGWVAAASFDGWQIARATADPELAWQYVLFAVGPEEDMTRSWDWPRPPTTSLTLSSGRLIC